MTFLSSSYGIIMYHAINKPGNRNNVVDGLNTTNKHCLKGEMELIGKLGSTNTTNIGMLTSASKMSPLNLQINVYIFSIINKYLMHSKLAQKYKRENHYSNIKQVYKIFKLI